MPAWLRGIMPVLIAIAVLVVLQVLLGDLPFFVYLASIVGVNVILAVSLNIVNGMTGQFSIGHAGFMAVGAYTAGKLSLLIKDVAISGLPGVVSDQVQFVGTLLAGGLAAAVCGFIVGLPSLRLRGDYLAIVTLGFGEIVRVILQGTRDQIQPWKANTVNDYHVYELPMMLGGPKGLNLLPTYTTLFWVYL